MRGALKFKLANAEDDTELRARMANDWMPGNISVSFRREPSFFHASRVQGETCEVIKCVDQETDKLVGLGSRLTRKVYINGEVQQIGYLADLRAHPDYRGGTGLLRGYRFLEELHKNDPVPFYYSMILEDNLKVNALLSSGRCGLPVYKDIGRFVTPAVYLDLPRRNLKMTGIEFRRASWEDLTDIIDFLSNTARDKQLTPVINSDYFDTPQLRDLDIGDFYLALRNGRIVGVVAAWDQTHFRQTHIEKYSGGLALMRPVYNFVSKFTPLKPLPREGSQIPYFYLAFVTIEMNNPEIFRGLLRYLYNQRRNECWHYFIAGFHETDPLLEVLRDYRRIDVAGRLYLVYYKDGESAIAGLLNRIPNVEMAMI
ncbi:MAG: hypothetical protein V3V18_08545 [Methylococcales bacterium]